MLPEATEKGRVGRARPAPAAPRHASPRRPSSPREIGAARRPHRPPRLPPAERAAWWPPGRAAAHLARSAGPRRRGSTPAVAGARTRTRAAAAFAADPVRGARGPRGSLGTVWSWLADWGPLRLTQSPLLARRDVAGRADTPPVASETADAGGRAGARAGGSGAPEAGRQARSRPAPLPTRASWAGGAGTAGGRGASGPWAPRGPWRAVAGGVRTSPLGGRHLGRVDGAGGAAPRCCQEDGPPSPLPRGKRGFGSFLYDFPGIDAGSGSSFVA